MSPDRIPRRRGFTLLELLVVIALISALLAIGAAAVMRVREAQRGKVNSQNLIKMQTALDQQWKSVVDRCRKDKNEGKIHPAVMSLCENDPDRAEALWLYIQMRLEFPETFLEASGDTCPNTSQASPGGRGIWIWYPAVTSNPAVLIARPKKTFAQVPATSTGNPNGEAAALLYMILAEKTAGGAGGGAEDWGQSIEVPVGGSSYRVFRDTFGVPVTFRRFFQHQEINLPPFVKTTDTFHDPLDSRGKLATTTSTWTSTGTVNQTNSGRKDQAAAAVGLTAANLDGVNNKVITVISFGPNRNYEGNPLGTTDDFFGYRLRKLGNQGD